MNSNKTEKETENPAIKIIETITNKDILKKYSNDSGKCSITYEEYLRYFFGE